MRLPFAQDASPLVRFTLEPLWQDHGIPLALMGIIVVFSALTLVVVLISVLPKIIERFVGQQASLPTEAAESLLGSQDDHISEETLAVIAAAVASTLQRPHRVIRVRGLTPEDLGWSLEGRMQHHRSHKVQHRDHG